MINKNIKTNNMTIVRNIVYKQIEKMSKNIKEVIEIKYNSDNNIQMPVYQFIMPSYTFKQTIKPFTRTKTFKECYAPTDSKISSIYSSYQNSFRTNDVDRHISKYSTEDTKNAA